MSKLLSQSAPGPKPIPTGTQLATAFEGKLERLPISPWYHFSIVLVSLAMITLPVVYLGIIAGAVWLIAFQLQSAKDFFGGIGSPRAILFGGALFIAILTANALFIVGLVVPIFWRSKRQQAKTLYVDRREQPLLYAYIDQLCDAMNAPRPARIDVVAVPYASAHIDNGFLGLISRRLVLTIGLPLASSMDLKQFTSVIAHEMGHFSQGVFMRLSFAVSSLNQWFAGIAYRRSGIDDLLNDFVDSEAHWSVTLVGLVGRLMLWLARNVLIGMALLSHALTMRLSRYAEFDADSRSARIVGSEAAGNALQQLPFLLEASDIVLRQAANSWKKRILGDDIVVMTSHLNRNLPPQVKQSLTNRVLTADSAWHDSHPPLFKRVGALKKQAFQGVLKLDADATCLFRDYEELCKISTIHTYQSVLGTALKPEHLVPVKIDG